MMLLEEIQYVCACGNDASSATGCRAVWPCPGAPRYVEKPAFADSPTCAQIQSENKNN